MKSQLVLIPVPLTETYDLNVFSELFIQQVHALKHFVVEDVKSAKRFLKNIQYPFPFETIEFQTLNEHSKLEEVQSLLSPLIKGESVGLLSEAGCPAVADPGSALVKLAHKKKIAVLPLVGPSSILLALMASGMNGQSFSFHGYLPKEQADRIRKLKEIEKSIRNTGSTHLFIETPYRNRKLFDELLQYCSQDINLCIACDLTSPNEFIYTSSIAEWKKITAPDINKRPAIFLLGN